LLEKGMISQLQPVRLLYCIAFIYCSYYWVLKNEERV
jgi:hypothetical protein